MQCNCNYKISLFVGFILELFTCADLLFLPIYTHYKLFRNCFNDIDVSILYRSIIVIENSNWIEFSVEFQGICPLNACYLPTERLLLWIKTQQKYIWLLLTQFFVHFFVPNQPKGHFKSENVLSKSYKIPVTTPSYFAHNFNKYIVLFS